MQHKSSYATDVGMTRKVNEDSVHADDSVGLYVVCDGMGGHKCGDVASSTSVELISASVASARSGGDKKDGDQVIVEAIKLANQGVFEISANKAECKGMGTTVVAALYEIGNKKIIIGHAGDSRAYRLRGGELERLTSDHSLVEEQLEAGLISKEEAENSTQKNIITRAIGQNADIEVTVRQEDVAKGDMILLCSDGLSNMVIDSDICEILNKAVNVDEAVIELVDMANKNGGNDNISAVVVAFD